MIQEATRRIVDERNHTGGPIHRDLKDGLIVYQKRAVRRSPVHAGAVGRLKVVRLLGFVVDQDKVRLVAALQKKGNSAAFNPDGVPRDLGGVDGVEEFFLASIVIQ